MDPGERGLEALALGHQLLLGARGRHAQERLGRNAGRARDLERARHPLELPFHPLEVVAHETPVILGRLEPRQRPAEPRLGLFGRERDREDVDKLSLEVVRLVDDQEPPPAQLLGAPVAERREVRGVGAEDRTGQRRRLRPRVRTLTHRAARPPAHSPRRRHARVRVALAEVVVTPLDELQVGAELSLVLIL